MNQQLSKEVQASNLIIQAIKTRKTRSGSTSAREALDLARFGMYLLSLQDPSLNLEEVKTQLVQALWKWFEPELSDSGLEEFFKDELNLPAR